MGVRLGFSSRIIGPKHCWHSNLLASFHFRVECHEFNYSHEPRSGLDFVNLRAGQYADASPLYLNWLPPSRSVLLPKIKPSVSESKIACAFRDELGEAMATLLVKGLTAYLSIRPQTEKNIILFTGPTAQSPVEWVDAIDRGRGTSIPIEYLHGQHWIVECAKHGEGGKPRAWFEARLVWMQGVSDGDAATVDPALETVLRRRPETGTEAVERLVRADPEYRWNQNHFR